MDWKKKEELLAREMPHVRLAEGTLESSEDLTSDAQPEEIDTRSSALSTWDKFAGIDARVTAPDSPPSTRASRQAGETDLSALRQQFRRRYLTGQGAGASADDQERRAGSRASSEPRSSRFEDLRHGHTEIAQVRPREATDDTEAKDVILDDEEGIIGAQG